MKLLILSLFIFNSYQLKAGVPELSITVSEIEKNIDLLKSSQNQVTCPQIVTPYDDGKCRSQEMFFSPGDESAKASATEWLDKPIKVNDPFAPTNALLKGAFDVKGPGMKSAFCINCYHGNKLMKEQIKEKNEGKTDKDRDGKDRDWFQKKLKDAYIEKQTETWAKRFQEIQNNIAYMQLEANTHQLPAGEIAAVANHCSPEKVYKIITKFIDKQVQLAAEKGSPTCPALKNVDVSDLKRVFRSKTKIAEERTGNYKNASESRFASLSDNVKKMSTISCLNEAVFQKAYTGFNPTYVIRDFITMKDELMNKPEEVRKLIRAALLRDPKYNFNAGDEKTEKEISKLSDSLLKNIFDPMLSDLNHEIKENAKLAPEDRLSRWELLQKSNGAIDEYESRMTKMVTEFDKEQFSASLAHLKNECNDLADSHLEAVICHDPAEVDLTDIDLVASLNTFPRLGDCIYKTNLEDKGLVNMTPFCAQFVEKYCESDANEYQHKYKDEEKYREKLGKINTKVRDFKSLRFDDESDKFIKDADLVEKKICSPAEEEIKKHFPLLRKGTLAYKKKLEEVAFEQVREKLTGAEAADLTTNNIIFSRLADFFQFEKEKSEIANKTSGSGNKSADGGGNGGEKIDPLAATFGGAGSSSNGSGSSVTESGQDSPTFLGMEDVKAAMRSGVDPLESSTIKDAAEELSGASSQSSVSQNSFFNKPVANNSYSPSTTVRTPEEIKKDEKVLENNKTQISSIKQQLQEKKDSLGANYKSDPEYLAKEKKLKELEATTRELERKLLAEKDQRIKELEKLLAKKDGDKDSKDYKKLYEELNQAREARNSIVNPVVNGNNSSVPSGTFSSSNSNSVPGNQGQVNNSTSGNSSSGSSGISNYSGAGSSGSQNINSSSSGSSSGGANYVVAQNTKPSDVPLISLTIEELKSINQPNVENARKAVEEILKKHNGSVIGNRLYVQTKDEKGVVSYHVIDLKILKSGEKVVVVKNEDKKDQKKPEKKARRATATVKELEDALK